MLKEVSRYLSPSLFVFLFQKPFLTKFFSGKVCVKYMAFSFILASYNIKVFCLASSIQWFLMYFFQPYFAIVMTKDLLQIIAMFWINNICFLTLALLYIGWPNAWQWYCILSQRTLVLHHKIVKKNVEFHIIVIAWA